MRKWAVVIAVLVALSIGGSARAAPIYVWGGSTDTGAWSDVNKTSVSGDPDSLLCWAASASNVLAWTGWWGWDSPSGTYLDTASEIYAVFDAGWTNTEGSPTYAYEWWMTDRTQSITGGEVFDSPGLNFYPGVDVQEGSSVTAFWASPGETAFSTYIADQRGIVMSLDVGAYSHAVTLWGWDPVAMEMYITDSDDGLTALRTLDYYVLGGRYYLDGYTNLYTGSTDALVTQLTRLNQNDLFTEPARPSSAVPEPTTLLLLGTGLAGLVLRRKRL